uniref:Variant surface glycoprotein 1125.4770 n=1 Tax=Trypanosoma brucei TaxID=5691 RepID=A0A1J0RB35_9TRYP|nr:variant surface glycoprotein 1125.4770 [Trypanosoma brucei]
MQPSRRWVLATIAVVAAARASTNNCTDATHEETYIGELQKKLATKHTQPNPLTSQLLKAQLIAALTPSTAEKLKAQAIANLYKRCLNRDDPARRQAAITEMTKLADLALHFGRHDALKAVAKIAVAAKTRTQTNTGGSAVVKAIAIDTTNNGITKSVCHIEEYSTAPNTGANHQHWATQQLTLRKLEPVTGADSNTPNAAQLCVGAQNSECTGQGAYVIVQSGPLFKSTAAANPQTGATKTNAASLTIYLGDDKQAQQLAKLDAELISATKEAATVSACTPQEQLDDLDFLEDAAAAADPGHKRPKADSSNKQNLQMTVKKLYGDQPSDFESKFWKTFDDLLVPTKTENKIEKKKFSAIAGVKQLRQSLELAAMMAIIDNDAKKTATCTAAVATSETTACAKKLKKLTPKKVMVANGTALQRQQETTANRKDDKKEVNKISATECTATEEGKCAKKVRLE